MALLYRWPMQDDAASRTVVETVGAANAETASVNTSVATVAGPGGLYPKAIDIAATAGRSIRTPVLALSGTPRITLAMWINAAAIGGQIIAELSPNYNNVSGTCIVVFDSFSGLGNIYAALHAGARYNGTQYNATIGLSEWIHYAFLYDFSLAGGSPAIKTKIVINGVEPTIQNNTLLADNPTGNFANQRFYFGARNQTSFPLNGAFAGIHLYDTILTTQEINDLIAEASPGGGRLINGGLVNGGLINRGLMR